MRKNLLFLLLILFCSYSFSQEEWVNLNAEFNPDSFKPTLISATGNSSIIKFSVDGFSFHSVTTPNGEEKIISAPNASRILEAGVPDVVKYTASVLIPDNSAMQVNIIEYEYQEFTDIEIAPSKGNLYRNQIPEEIPFQYGSAYEYDGFFPGNLAELANPYIIRDYRGVPVHVYPFQYNPVTKVLRVYSNIIIEVTEGIGEVINPKIHHKSTTSVDAEFKNIYSNHFINYSAAKNPLLEPEEGAILIISHGPYMEAMEPYVEWKNQIGHPTTIYNVADIGTTPAQIKAFVQTYYNNTNLTYLLIVGDGQHVPPFNVSTSMGAGHSDNRYSYLHGTDFYPDIFVGRFSAESVAHVETQVQRTLEYEKVINQGTGWYDVAMGVARDEGAGIGHNGGESDCVHMDIIRNVLLNYNYTTVHQDYDDGCTGVPNTNATQISNRINAGVSLINYCNHGSLTGWSVASYNHNHVNALTNVGKLPFIWTVACVNGNFVGNTCFAEHWLRATHNGEPTGALVTNMSTVNQSWHPPMDAQDEFNEILTGMHANNIKRTFTGIAVQGYYKMNDVNGAQGYEMTDTWTTFGDPSVKIRTDNPLPIVINHVDEVLIGTTQIIVECDVEDAYIALTINNEIIGTAFVSGGEAVINIDELESPGDEILVVATGYNRIPAYGTIQVIEILEPPVADFIGEPTTILEGESVQFTCLSEYAQQRDWTFGDGGTSTVENPLYTYTEAGVYTVSLLITNNLGTDVATKTNYITVNQNTNPPVADFTADNTLITVGQTVSFTDLTENLINTWEWSFEGGNPTSSTDQHPSVVYNSPGTYSVTLSVTNDFGNDQAVKNDFITVVIPDYCEAYADQNEEYISNVTFNTINNNSGWDGGYSDFTDIETTVLQGQTYEISITNEVYYSLDEVYVWIDYNMNGSFDDPEELVFFGESTGITTENPHTWTGNITIPESTNIGATRMRVRLNYGGSVGGSVPNSTPCGMATYGEVEDYTVILSAPDVPPTANFSAESPNPCESQVQFNDESSFAETWLWDFGDGNTSTEQNPVHNYSHSGSFTVSLTVTNPYGEDDEIKNDYITIDLPEAPLTTGDEACGESELTLTASGNGILQWYDAPTNGSLINTGTSYTNTFSETTTLYVQSLIENINTFSGGKEDNSSVGGNFGGNAEHGLIFNAETDFILKSVLVYASGEGNRTIRLLDSEDQELESITINIPDGESRVDLDFAVPQGSGYTLMGPPNNANLYRNGAQGAADLPYPFVTEGVVNVYSNTAEGLTNNYLSYYYYFYDWEIEVSQDCSSARIPVTATINTNPTVDLGEDINHCGESVTLDAGEGFVSYTWDGNPGGQTLEITESATITVEVEDINGCHAFDQINIDIYPEISISTESTSESSIGAADGTATVIISGGTPDFIISWDTEEDTQTITGLEGGTYYVTVTDDNGCFDTDYVVVNTEGTPPTANFHADSYSGCDELTVIFTDASSNNPDTWLWNFGDGNSSDQQSPTHTYTTPGVYTVSLTVTNAFGTDTHEIIDLISVGETPQISLSMTEETELGAEDGTATVNVIFDGTYSVEWNNSETTETITNLIAGTYCVTVADIVFGCEISDCIEVTQGEIVPGDTPVADFNTDQTSGCEELTVEFTDASQNNPHTWLWNFGDGNTSDQQSPTHTYSTPGVYTVSLTVTNDFGTDTHEIADFISIGETPQISLSMTEETEPGAEDGTATVNVIFDGTYSVEWNNSETTESITNLIAGTYCVTVADIVFGCEISDCIEVTQGTVDPGDGPIADFTSNQQHGCNSLTVQFTDLSDNNPSSWLWNFGDGMISTLQNPLYTYSQPGVYTVSLSVTNDEGSDIIEMDDYIQIGETPVFNVNVTHASGEGIADGEASLTITGGIPPHTVLWSTGEDAMFIIDLLPGIYSVMVSDAYNCMSSQAFEVEFHTGLADIATEYRIYPNPAEDYLFIVAENSVVEKVEIFDVLGKTVKTILPNANSVEININSIIGGVYFVRIYSSESQFTEKIIIK